MVGIFLIYLFIKSLNYFQKYLKYLLCHPLTTYNKILCFLFQFIYGMDTSVGLDHCGVNRRLNSLNHYFVDVNEEAVSVKVETSLVLIRVFDL